MRILNPMFGILLFAAMLALPLIGIFTVVYILGWVICVGFFVRLYKEERDAV